MSEVLPTIVRLSVHELTPNQCAELATLTRGKEGVMQSRLRRTRKTPERDDEVLLLADPQQILGWCLTFVHEGERICHFYVRPECRGHGYGIMLLGAAIGEFAPFAVYPTTDEAYRFFLTFSDQITIHTPDEA